MSQRVGDPPSARVIAHGSRAQRCAIGAGFRLGEDRGGQCQLRCDPGQPGLLLRVGAGSADEFAGDLRAGTERTRGDPSAAQLLGNNAHGQLAEPQPAIAWIDADAERSHIGHLADHLVGNQRVAQVPGVGVGSDPLPAETAELLAHGIEHVILQAIRRTPVFADRRGKRRARSRYGPLPEQPGDGGIVGQFFRRGSRSEIGGPNELVLAHRQATEQLGEMFAEGHANQLPLTLAERAGDMRACVPFVELGQRLCDRRDPGEPVQAPLVAIHPGRVLRDAGLYPRDEPPQCTDRLARDGEHVGRIHDGVRIGTPASTRRRNQRLGR